MPQSITVLQSQAFERFQCIDSDCEDSCCRGWQVVIDKRTYDKYRECDDPELRPLMDKNIAVLESGTTDIAYAQIKSTDSRCAFLTEERRCRIQEKLGENALSRACATFPRAVSLVDGVLECSLYLSCPEAARSVLFDPESMVLTRSTRSEAFRFASPPTVETGDRNGGKKPYEYFLALRDLVLLLIRDRSYALWERLLILGFVCEDLDKSISAGNGATVGQSVESYASQIDAGLFRGAFGNVGCQPGLQTEFVTKWMEARIGDGNVTDRFVGMYELYRQGVGDYVEAGGNHYRRFMEERPHILENYVANYVIRTLFPFGPQKSLYPQQRSVFDEYVLLILHYAMIRTLLVGVSGARKEQFGEDDVILVVQSFAKAIEHNLPFLKRMLSFIEGRNLNSLVYLAALLRE